MVDELFGAQVALRPNHQLAPCFHFRALVDILGSLIDIAGQVEALVIAEELSHIRPRIGKGLASVWLGIQEHV